MEGKRSLSGAHWGVQRWLVLTLVDKMIPGPGPHFFSVRADADGEETGKPVTQGTEGEFMAFLAYSELDDKGDQIKWLLSRSK